MYQLTRLDNGLRIATAAMPHMASVSLGFWVGVGGRFESADLSGASHFIEHLLFKGTRKRSARQISQDVEGLGGYLNAFTSEENTCFFAKAGHDRLPDLLDVLFDMFLHSRFDPAEIRKEREVIKEEVAMYRDQPQHYVHELLNAAQWPDQPLGRSITGTIKNLLYGGGLLPPNAIGDLQSKSVLAISIQAFDGGVLNNTLSNIMPSPPLCGPSP